ncbi:hypothetical protein OBBRIDRAFT_626415 [Obba rivulosa]|uniref:Uncharacterized protein n=1 Tax=Obba rivulosa TaxID=1052685 RepID=A0A8E2B0Q6_9APHY|nr:hypothetical protein OBBRIDRAFT_626415 [Obba rivulosa]
MPVSAQSPSTLAAELGVGDRWSVTDFARAVHASAIRLSPITTLALYRTPKPSKHFNHRFIIATVRLRTKELPHDTESFLRIEFLHDDLVQGESISQIVRFSDSHHALTKGSQWLGKIVAKSRHEDKGLSLDAFASLLQIVHARMPLHDMSGRTRQWMTNIIILACAQQYRDQWSAGHIRSAPLRWYMEGKSDAEPCNKQLWTDDPTIRWVSQKVFVVKRGMRAHSAHDTLDCISPKDEEMRQVLEAWNPRLPASWETVES